VNESLSGSFFSSMFKDMLEGSLMFVLEGGEAKCCLMSPATFVSRVTYRRMQEAAWKFKGGCASIPESFAAFALSACP
jgi:hypothetical protein